MRKHRIRSAKRERINHTFSLSDRSLSERFLTSGAIQIPIRESLPRSVLTPQQIQDLKAQAGVTPACDTFKITNSDSTRVTGKECITLWIPNDHHSRRKLRLWCKANDCTMTEVQRFGGNTGSQCEPLQRLEANTGMPLSDDYVCRIAFQVDGEISAVQSLKSKVWILGFVYSFDAVQSDSESHNKRRYIPAYTDAVSGKIVPGRFVNFKPVKPVKTKDQMKEHKKYTGGHKPVTGIPHNERYWVDLRAFIKSGRK